MHNMLPDALYGDFCYRGTVHNIRCVIREHDRKQSEFQQYMCVLLSEKTSVANCSLQDTLVPKLQCTARCAAHITRVRKQRKAPPAENTSLFTGNSYLSSSHMVCMTYTRLGLHIPRPAGDVTILPLLQEKRLLGCDCDAAHVGAMVVDTAGNCTAATSDRHACLVCKNALTSSIQFPHEVVSHTFHYTAVFIGHV